ncbi:acyl-CoA synthetase bubblegum member [Homalodisca vitripennis]|nr:acyl-CoA synthetase bubblegum member [Homalodisca vitripennis]
MFRCATLRRLSPPLSASFPTPARCPDFHKHRGCHQCPARVRDSGRDLRQLHPENTGDRGFAVGMYTTNNPDACYHCLHTSEANICVVEDDKQLQKILKIRDQLPHLRAIIQYSGTPSNPGVMSWTELMELGKNQDDTQLNAALKKIAINECCTLVFTQLGTWNMSSVFPVCH